MKNNILRTTQISMLVALVAVLQIVGTFFKIGVFPLSLVLIPIVVGASLYGSKIGALLGFTFGVVALVFCISGADAGGAMMWQANFWLTAITCLAKGTAAGWCAGIIAQFFQKKGKPYIGVLLASMAAPIVNTGIFLLILTTCFNDTLVSWAAGGGYGSSAWDLAKYILGGIVLINFGFEFISTTALSPATKRIIDAVKKSR